MKIAAVCVTWNRPKHLGRMIRCFEQQDYPNRELVILDDADQYIVQADGRSTNTIGDRWKLFSCAMRYPSLGLKRNAATRLVPDEFDAIAVWDDDDLYMPWALSATVAALQKSPLSRPSLVLHPDKEGRLHQHRTDADGKDLGKYLFHSGWGYRKGAFSQVGGYPPIDNGEDQVLLREFDRLGIVSADPIALGYKPFLVYPWETSEKQHISGAGPNGYENFGRHAIERTDIRKWIDDPPIDLCEWNIVLGIKKRKF